MLITVYVSFEWECKSLKCWQVTGLKFEGRDLGAESTGGSPGSAGAPVSRHPGAAGEGGDWLMQWEFGKQSEIRKVKLENIRK